MHRRLASAIIVLFAIAGCYEGSLAPFYVRSDLVASPNLTGTWRLVKHGHDGESNDDTTMVTFTPEGIGRYVAGRGTDDSAHFAVFTLNGNTFIGYERSEGDFVRHDVCRVVVSGAELILINLKNSWLLEHARDAAGPLPRLEIYSLMEPDSTARGTFLLASRTAVLRDFLVKAVAVPEVWGDSIRIVR